MNIGYLLLAVVPLGILLGYGSYRLLLAGLVERFLNKSKIAKAVDAGVAVVDNEEENFISEIGDEIDDLAEKAMSSVEEAKVILFDSIYRAYNFLFESLKTLGHYLMHYFVIVMKLFRDFTDWLYTRSRDRFVETAAKERKSVRRFWKHLKEYKKESDNEE